MVPAVEILLPEKKPVKEDTPPVQNPSDTEGWTEVSRKARKIKRDLTIEEMDIREAEYEETNEGATEDFNGNLFETNRHDHHRV